MTSQVKRKNVLKVAMITAFMTTFMGSALNLSIPALEADYHVSGTFVGWIITMYNLTVASISVPIGKLADIISRKKVFVIGIAGFLVSSLLCAFSINIWMMLISRTLQGIFSAMIFATNNAILISCFPESRRGEVLGYSTAATYIGLSIGPVVGGMLNHYFNWQSIFISSAVISLICLILAEKNVDEDLVKENSINIDRKGNILYILMIAFSLYGLTSITSSKYGWAMLILGIVLAGVFIAVERKVEHPLIKIEMFSEDREFTLSNIAALLNYGATFAISYLISLYLQVVMGFDSHKAGLLLICMPLVQAIFSPMMGKLSDKVRPAKLATEGMILCVIALLIFSQITEDTSLWYIILGLLVAGFGFSLFSSPNTNAIMDCVDKKDYSIANSIVATMRNYGQTASMSIVSIVMGIYVGENQLEMVSSNVLITTLKTIFYIFTVLCIVAVIMSMKRKK